MKLKIAPSILSADFARLAEAIQMVEQVGGADLLHIDIMDGHYVPNLTIGPCVVGALRKCSKLFFVTHLMVSNPDSLIDDFAKAGSNRIVLHPETCSHLHRTLSKIKEMGLECGLALNPSTLIEACSLDYLGDLIDCITVMSVNPGFPAQKFIPFACNKIMALKEQLQLMQLSHIEIEVDGGINTQTAPLVVKAGANVLVAGNAIFNSPDPLAAIKNLRELIDGLQTKPK